MEPPSGPETPAGRYRPMALPTDREATTALIVENEALVRLELADELADLGLCVLAAADADEAIALMGAHPDIRLLLTDIKMPGSMDGIRLAHYVRHRWPPVKIIVVSGRLDTQLSELPLRSVFLPKPWGHRALTDALSHILSVNEPAARGPSDGGTGV